MRLLTSFFVFKPLSGWQIYHYFCISKPKHDYMKRVFLIGYMGSGKTTIGKLLAVRLGYSFLDIVQYLYRIAGEKDAMTETIVCNMV